MNKDLESAFKLVREQVQNLLKNETFPDSVEPADLREAVRMYPMRGGKRIRPALLMWSCGAAGGRPEQALHAAAAVEVYHNWTLVHDDIIDRDDFRRGKPACHAWLRDHSAQTLELAPERAAKYGSDFAILAGDVQQAWAVSLMLRSAQDGVPVEIASALTLRMQDFLNRKLISGEALDVQFEYLQQSPSRSEVVRMISGKTGALLAYCAESGTMIGAGTVNADDPRVRALSAYAENTGYAFQLLDDLLGVYGDAAAFGKPICSDFREGKPTILALEAFERMTPAAAAHLRSFMHQEITDSAIAEIQGLLEDCGARKAVEKEARTASDAALENLRKLPVSPWRDLLESLAEELLFRKV